MFKLGGATGNFGQLLVQCAVNSAVSQGVNIVVGTQNGFSWKEVAVSAVTSAVSTKAMSAIKGSDWIQNLGGARAQGAVTTAAGSVVSAGMRVALGGKVDFQSVFADIAGNLIGDSIVGGINSRSSGSNSGLTDEERQQTRAAAQKSWNEQLADSTAAMQKMTEDALIPLDVNPDFLANLPMPEINFGPNTYSVKSGDALEKIARANGMGPEGAAAIAQASGIRVGDVIRPGQELVIPDSYNSVAARNEYGKYLADANAAKAQVATAAAQRDLTYFNAAADTTDPYLSSPSRSNAGKGPAVAEKPGFFSGIGNALFQAVYQPLATTYDLEQVVYEAARSLITGQAPRDVNFASTLGQAAASGAGSGELLAGMAKSAILAPYHVGYGLGTAIYNGDSYLAGESLASAGLLFGAAKIGGAARGAIYAEIGTPWGSALQSGAPEALAARALVENGATLYRLGTLGKSEAAEAQFWALEHPLNPGFAGRYGIPAENVAKFNFIEAATLRQGTSFVTRPAPPVGLNPGGGIEVVVPSNGVTMKYFARH